MSTNLIAARPATAPDDDAARVDALVSKQLELLRRFTLAVFADPSLADAIPNDVTLVLLPDDDPDFVETEMTLGLAALRRGQDVYFRHVRLADLPDGPPADAGPAVGLRRTHFNRDGAVAAEAALGADGEWHPIERATEDTGEAKLQPHSDGI